MLHMKHIVYVPREILYNSTMFKSHQTGQLGESLALKFLQNKGFSLIEKNYRKPWGEIDIIVKNGSDLRFVEVKTVTTVQKVSRGTFDEYEPEDNIHPAKLKRLGRTIETYLLDKDISDDIDWQLDSIAVYLDQEGREIKIEWLENIY